MPCRKCGGTTFRDGVYEDVHERDGRSFVVDLPVTVCVACGELGKVSGASVKAAEDMVAMAVATASPPARLNRPITFFDTLLLSHHDKVCRLQANTKLFEQPATPNQHAVFRYCMRKVALHILTVDGCHSSYHMMVERLQRGFITRIHRGGHEPCDVQDFRVHPVKMAGVNTLILEHDVELAWDNTMAFCVEVLVSDALLSTIDALAEPKKIQVVLEGVVLP